MKFLKMSAVVLILLASLMLGGCNNKSIAQPILERDNYNTGGNITFVYDEVAHVATFGGKDEVLQYYEEDIAKGWTESGNRIGIKLSLPQNLKDYKSGKATFDGQKLMPDDYISLQEGQNLVAVFQPIIKNEKENYTLKITWQDGFEEQIYHIIIAKGTIFMQPQNV